MPTQRVDAILKPTTFGTVHIIRRGRHSNFAAYGTTTYRALVKRIATFQTRRKMSAGDKYRIAPLLEKDHTQDISNLFGDFRNRLCGSYGRQAVNILRVRILRCVR